MPGDGQRTRDHPGGQLSGRIGGTRVVPSERAAYIGLLNGTPEARGWSAGRALAVGDNDPTVSARRDRTMCSEPYASGRGEAGGSLEEGGMTTDEKLKLAVSVARAAARSGEYRRLDTLIEVVFRKLNDLAPSDAELHEHEREFKL